MRILAVNAGSSSLKASIVEGRRFVSTTVNWDRAGRSATLARALSEIHVSAHDVDAVAHRVVHGGERLTEPVVIDDAILEEIAAVGELAPLHNEVALETVAAARAAIPDRPHIACFDTAFHAGLPEVATRYPVPDKWRTTWGIRRFGFHGLSVEWAVDRAAELLGRAADDLQLVIAHLGSGCSVTAVSGRRSIWTSMGFTPLDGLMMRTRSGAIDPGILFHVVRRGGLRVEDVEQALEHASGLVAVGGHNGDVRQLGAAAADGDPDARLALDMFALHAAAGIAGAATSLPRLDAIVFTGGIGEHASTVRAQIVARLGVVGAPAIPALETGQDRILASGPVAVLRVEAHEDLVMARAAVRLQRDKVITAGGGA